MTSPCSTSASSSRTGHRRRSRPTRRSPPPTSGATIPVSRPMADQPALAVDDVVAGYGGVLALRGVSLSVRPGTITAVLGANGAGKTTLLTTISGFVRPRQGQITLAGADLTRRRPEEIARAGLAHVPEGQGVITELMVEENLRLGALWRHGHTGRAE